MAFLNKVCLIGNVGGQPEFIQKGEFATLSLATTENWKDKQTGEPREKTEWHRLVANNRLALVARDYVKKGQQLYIEGSLSTSKWTDKDGVERNSTEIQLTKLLMLGKKPVGAPEGTTEDDGLPF